MPAQTSTVTLTNTATPIPEPNWVKAYETSVTIPTYPFRDFLTSRLDPVYNMPVFYLDRASYEASNPSPIPIQYQAIILENPYLRLTILPELGGRLYSAILKATNQEIFYHNAVVKPSRYGLLQPPEANWWLALGGMEWAYPTQEHGYRWGILWAYEIETVPDAVSIILSDQAPDRVGVQVRISLAANSGLFTVTAQLRNLDTEAKSIQFWSNAALSLTAGSMSSHTQFIVPADQVTVHSRGADGWTVPDEKAAMSWPEVGSKRLNEYSQWANYLGFFIPHMDAPFIGAYNPIDDLGIARLIKPGTVPGNKVFAFSLTFPYRDYTDDASQYFEIWGGLNEGFWPENDRIIEPNQVIGWQEQWWPLAGLGGLSWANDQAAIFVQSKGKQTDISVLTPRFTRGRLLIEANSLEISDTAFTASPDSPFQQAIPGDVSPLTILVLNDLDQPVLKYQHP